MRALEVLELTGGFAASLPEHRAVYDVVQIGLDHHDLDIRVADRVAEMWAAGMVEEVQTLAGLGLRKGRTASRALGYAQVLAWLDGEIESSEAARLATIAATRRFVRRQRSWFRRDPRIIWLDHPDVDQVAGMVSSA